MYGRVKLSLAHNRLENTAPTHYDGHNVKTRCVGMAMAIFVKQSPQSRDVKFQMAKGTSLPQTDDMKTWETLMTES